MLKSVLDCLTKLPKMSFLELDISFKMLMQFSVKILSMHSTVKILINTSNVKKTMSTNMLKITHLLAQLASRSHIFAILLVTLLGRKEKLDLCNSNLFRL